MHCLSVRAIFIYYVKSYTRYINEVKYEYTVSALVYDLLNVGRLYRVSSKLNFIQGAAKKSHDTNCTNSINDFS